MSPKSGLVIIHEFHDWQFGWSSPVVFQFPGRFAHPFAHLFCLKCVQDTVRHGTCEIEWCWYTLIWLETGSFTVLQHKTKDLFVVKCYTYIYPSSFTVITNISVHKCSYSCGKYQYYISYKAAITLYTHSFKVTSIKIDTYSSICTVVVHSDVHLSSSVPSSSNPFFSFPICSSLTTEWQMQCHVHLTWGVSELCIMVSFDILHILELCMRITTYDFDSCIIFA